MPGYPAVYLLVLVLLLGLNPSLGPDWDPVTRTLEVTLKVEWLGLTSTRGKLVLAAILLAGVVGD